MGLVTDPHAHTSRAHKERPAGPGSLPQGRAVRGGRVLDTEQPSRRHQAPPLGTLVPPPQCARQGRRSVRWGVSDGSLRPHPPRQRKSGGRPQPTAPSTGGPGRESARPQTSLTEARRALLWPRPCAACTAHKASSQQRALELVTSSHGRTPCAHKKKGGSGPRAHAPRTDHRGREDTRPRTTITEA